MCFWVSKIFYILYSFLECWLVKFTVRILFMVLGMMFADKGQQEAKARDMILKEEE